MAKGKRQAQRKNGRGGVNVLAATIWGKKERERKKQVTNSYLALLYNNVHTAAICKNTTKKKKELLARQAEDSKGIRHTS